MHDAVFHYGLRDIIGVKDKYQFTSAFIYLSNSLNDSCRKSFNRQRRNYINFRSLLWRLENYTKNFKIKPSNIQNSDFY